MIKKGDPKITKAWTYYDWANSVYALVISTAIFPIYYNEVTTQKDDAGGFTDTLFFFGKEFVNTELYSYVIAASLFIVVILSPILSGIADYSGKKKFFLKVFCYIGSIACATLFFFNTDHLELSMLSVLLASIGYWNSIVFYNSFLPEIAEPEDHDKLSAKGYSRGYIGSVILLIACLILIMVLEVSAGWSFILVALWWAGFAQYTFKWLPENTYSRKAKGNLISHGFEELMSVYKKVRKTKRLKAYLLSFFIFSMAVQTIMLMAQFFGMKEIWRYDEAGELVRGLSQTQLIVSIILVQLIASPGAYVFSWCSSKLGNKKTLMIALSVWIIVCVCAFLFVREPKGFYITAMCIGFVMGGTQSLSRSTYSKFLPETQDHASYFSLYDVLEKIGIIIGMFSFGYIEGVTGSMRNSLLSLVVFFTVGLLLLFLIPKKEIEIEGSEFKS